MSSESDDASGGSSSRASAGKKRGASSVVDVEGASEIVTELQKEDVICGRGGRGSERDKQNRPTVWAKLVIQKRAEYQETENKNKKKEVVDQIVKEVKDHSGRFLKECESGVWTVMTDDEARNKTMQALRQKSKKDKTFETSFDAEAGARAFNQAYQQIFKGGEPQAPIPYPVLPNIFPQYVSPALWPPMMPDLPGFNPVASSDTGTTNFPSSGKTDEAKIPVQELKQSVSELQQDVAQLKDEVLRLKEELCRQGAILDMNFSYAGRYFCQI